MAALQARTDRTGMASLAVAPEDGEGRDRNVQRDPHQHALLSSSFVMTVCRKTLLERLRLVMALGSRCQLLAPAFSTADSRLTAKRCQAQKSDLLTRTMFRSSSGRQHWRSTEEAQGQSARGRHHLRPATLQPGQTTHLTSFAATSASSRPVLRVRSDGPTSCDRC